ncbi:MAG: DSD1 family PLP-dependent enzyme [Meiothermus sp.]|nr:DSD1 family PLP-dependent enzyme [Meiothermus sp.]
MQQLIGQPISALDTPALLVDLDALERNIARGFAALEGTGVTMRPHLKTGKSPHLARCLLAAGAVGVCVAKLGEAEVMAAAGIDDILITSELVGEAKLRRLVALLRDHPRVRLVVDSPQGAAGLSAALEAAGLSAEVLLEVNVGQNRCGVLPSETLGLAGAVARLPGLRLVGLQGYEGHLQHGRDREQRRAACLAAMDALGGAAEALRRAGHEMRVVSTGGSGTYTFCARHPAVTEVQPGSFAFMDTDYLATPGLPFESALRVSATVISRPAPERAVTDAGLKSLSTDSGFAEPFGLSGWAYRPGGDEHGILDRASPEAPELAVGDRLELIPSHIDTTLNLHDFYLLHRGGVVAEVWPIAARGKVA